MEGTKSRARVVPADTLEDLFGGEAIVSPDTRKYSIIILEEEHLVSCRPTQLPNLNLTL